TWQTFDVGPSPAERAPRAEVLKVLFEAGGSAIDSSPMYGRAEGVVGDLLAAAGTRDKAFLATKVWTQGRDAGVAQMTESPRLLPLAQERGIAVLVNQPFGGGGLLRKLLPRPLPQWAGEIGCTSWAQLLLKFVLAQPAVTCVIPGTAKPEHMRDNAQAGLGAYPDARLLQRMTREIAI